VPDELSGRRVAILAADGFEQSELVAPRQALLDAGAAVDVVSLTAGEILGVEGLEQRDRVPVDRTVADASADDYDALLLPGGLKNPDTLRQDEAAVAFARAFVDAGRPVGAICHGPWVLIEADVLRGRTITSYPSIRTDVINAGGTWVDEEVHVDNGLVTSRRPDDLPAFCAKLVEEIGEGAHGAAGSTPTATDEGSAESFPASDTPTTSAQHSTGTRAD
jgi:protease I